MASKTATRCLENHTASTLDTAPTECSDNLILYKANIASAGVEEDRCREALSPYAMVRVTEELSPRLTDEAWRRKYMGIKESSLAARERVDDALADIAVETWSGSGRNSFASESLHSHIEAPGLW